MAILDSAAVYRRALMGFLAEAGFDPEDPEDLFAWITTPGPGVLLWTMRSDEDWQALRQLTPHNVSVVVMALLMDASPDSYAEALQSGADAAVAWEAEPDAIVKALLAALDGNALLPVGVARSLAAKVPAPHHQPPVSEEEVQWLRILAAGATIEELSRAVGYTPRTSYRLLRKLYERMGVPGRTQAILQAYRWGIIE